MTMTKHRTNGRRLGVAAVVALLTVGALAACGHVMGMMRGGAARPAASEFGLGPRPTAAGLYTVTLVEVEPLAKRRLQKVHVKVIDAAGAAVDGAMIEVDGGMPQHGHGLPTRPRMTGPVASGLYEIDGVRFNMGGWWEFRLAIRGPAGADAVTFNLDL